MESAAEAMPRRVTSAEEPGAGRESRETPDAGVEQLQGFRDLKHVRKLHYDEYAAFLLFYFFNSVITSLRGFPLLLCEVARYVARATTR